MEAAPLILVVMGVMGCGKSTVAAMLAARLGCACYEGDAYHPAANIDKMRAGIPLTDDDRWPWLEQLAAIVQRHLADGQPAVLACSALKPAYRQLLRSGRRGGSCDSSSSINASECRSSGQTATAAGPAAAAGDSSERWQDRADGRVAFVLLDPPRALLEQRLEARAAAGDHFTPGTALLASQLAALEYEEAELLLRVAGDPFPPAEHIVTAVLQRLQGRPAA